MKYHIFCKLFYFFFSLEEIDSVTYGKEEAKWKPYMFCIQKLVLGNCRLGEETATSLRGLISSCRPPLMHLDLSGNPSIGMNGGAILQESMVCYTSWTFSNLPHIEPSQCPGACLPYTFAVTNNELAHTDIVHIVTMC